MASKLLYIMLFSAAVLSVLLTGCVSPQRRSIERYASGVGYYLDDLKAEEATEKFELSTRDGFILPGVYCSQGILLIKQGRPQEGIALIEKEYELYKDPAVAEYLRFIRERTGIGADQAAEPKQEGGAQ